MLSTELDDFFYFDPAFPRMVGYATTPAIVREDGATAISIAAQLLDRANKKPSGKWLWLQVQPEDALVLVATILALARTEGWPLQPNIVEAVERFRLSDKPVKH